MTRKSILLVLVLLLILSTTATFAYLVAQVKTNDQIIKIGGGDVTGATLTPLFTSDKVLVPTGVTITQNNEVKMLQWRLTVDSAVTKTYTLDTVLTSEFRITTDRPVGVYNYSTSTTYTITLELLEEVDYSTYTFYLFLNFS